MEAVCPELNIYKEECKSRSKGAKSIQDKHALAAPYHFFLTGIKLLPETYSEDLTITFPELLDQNLGHLDYSLHVNFMVDLPWLLAQYAVNDLYNPSMIILYGVGDEYVSRLKSHSKVTAIRIKSAYPFGHHHTKLSIFFYNDKSLRFAVYTANLIESDWEDRTQGVWISPRCPYLGDEVPINYGESETFFKVDILQYLNSYHLPQLRDCLLRIQKSDCSSIKVCFVASIPGEHEHDYGYRKLGKLIRKHSTNSFSIPLNLVAQCSSIGSLGPSPHSWLLSEFAKSLCQTTVQKLDVIFPSVENVKCSIYGMYGGACLPYSSGTHRRQTWLNEYLMQWKSDARLRSKSVPHIKTYANISSGGKKLFWFLLSSANLSKAAWGNQMKSGRLLIRSYEAGVLFFPRILVNEDAFDVKNGDRASTGIGREFPLPYDFPLTQYRPTDEIFLYDKHFPH